MSTFDQFDDVIQAWFDDEAGAAIPSGEKSQALAVTAGRRARPRPLADIGSHWVGEAPWTANVELRPAWLIVVVLAALAVLGTALLVAAPKPAPLPPDGGQLLYDHDGDVVLANADGAGATVIVDGEPEGDPSGTFYRLIPETWAPDGRHFVFHEYGPTGPVAHIADATGRSIATFVIDAPSDGAGGRGVVGRGPTRDLKATNYQTWWSPDSTMLASFPWVATEVTVFGMDGKVVAVMPLPAGYEMFREFGLSGWMPDGRSVLANITSRARNLRPEVWQLALDGSEPQQVPDGNAFVDPGWDLSPDGSMVTFRGHVALDGSDRFAALPAEGADTIYVADVDGGNARAVPGTTHFSGVGRPQWSPDGKRIVYTTASHGYRYDLHVVVATGEDRLVARVLSDDWAGYEWSPGGDAILIGAFAVEPGILGPNGSRLDDGTTLQDRVALVSLWRVAADGSTVQLTAERVNDFDIKH
jgi:Tol biopolymer transport system component